jgi:hypothetical protein
MAVSSEAKFEASTKGKFDSNKCKKVRNSEPLSSCHTKGRRNDDNSLPASGFPETEDK